MFTIEYDGFLQRVKREFKTKDDAEYWLRCIGKKELIYYIKKVKNVTK